MLPMLCPRTPLSRMQKVARLTRELNKACEQAIKEAIFKILPDIARSSSSFLSLRRRKNTDGSTAQSGRGCRERGVRRLLNKLRGALAKYDQP